MADKFVIRFVETNREERRNKEVTGRTVEEVTRKFNAARGEVHRSHGTVSIVTIKKPGQAHAQPYVG